MENFKKIYSRYRLYLYFFIYGLVTFITILHHEPFRDEAQAWLIVRQLNLSQIFNQMWLEGSPCLWHLILYPLVKLGLPYFSINIVSWLIAQGFCWLMLFKSPFKLNLKLLILFSFLFIFEYAVIARNYGISILLLFLIATFWKKRYEKSLLIIILLILCSHTNLVVWGFCLIMGFLFIIDIIRDHKIPKLNKFLLSFLLGMGFLLVILQVIPRDLCVKNHALIEYSFWQPKDICLLPEIFMNSLLTVTVDKGSILISMLFFIFALFALLVLIKKPPVFIGLFCSWLWLIYLSVFINRGHLRHHGFLLVFMLFFYWIEKYYQDDDKILFISKIVNVDLLREKVLFILKLILIISTMRSVCVIRHEIKSNFSGGKETAVFLRENNLERYPWAGHQSYLLTPILPYFPNKEIWYAGICHNGSYVNWDRQFCLNRNISTEEVIKRVEKHFGDEIYVLILSDFSEDLSEYGYELVFHNKERIFWVEHENYGIYIKKR